MAVRSLARRLWERATTLAGTAFIAAIFLLAGSSAVMYGAVSHTARSEFCNSCHIMEPYYKSWQESHHANVPCIDCHYEPGSLETLEGKFKALSQLAKYVTRTQGTKPWAEVSDQSCMRSGCHAVRMLEGEVKFGEINFDHRHHLLESRRGRRLRCTSCHSQLVQGQHVAVTGSVCITCHFMPDETGAVPEASSSCLICHGPPKGPIEVAGREFVHADYVDRGVACRECHNPVIEGNGTVRKERCHSCHAEIGHVERIGETEFLHEKHVTEHKVECFECHDEIHHGLLPLKTPTASKHEGCGVCHENSHDAAGLVYAGTGAVGVADAPSRMFQTRVVCEACHTGRSGFLVRSADLAASGGPGPALAAAADAASRTRVGGAASGAAGGAHGAAGDLHGAGAHASTVAAAGNVDCIHCHGTGYDGLLGQWQAAVGEQIDRLRPLLAELEPKVAAESAEGVRKSFDEARRNLALVTLDGSRGAHNVAYALDALRASAERIDTLRAMLNVESGARAVDALPFRSADGCTSCHAGAGRPADVWPAERVFPHQRHLANGLECSACHSTQEHGQPAFPRTQCASCHHQESETRDVSDCASCHPMQSQLQSGQVPGFAEQLGNMSSMECSECHGEAPAIVRPKANMCVLCHESGYDDTMRAWQTEVDGQLSRLEAALKEADVQRLGAEKVERARKALAAVRGDGTRGVHNVELTRRLLEEGMSALTPP